MGRGSEEEVKRKGEGKIRGEARPLAIHLCSFIPYTEALLYARHCIRHKHFNDE